MTQSSYNRGRFVEGQKAVNPLPELTLIMNEFILELCLQPILIIKFLTGSDKNGGECLENA